MKSNLILCGFLFCGAVTVRADLHQWTDEQGVIHVVDDSVPIPEAYRDRVKTYRAVKPATGGKTAIAPSWTYQENSQGAFAQKLALDLGLINNAGEDALGPLGAVGIQPAGGWQVSDLLTSEAQSEVVAAARRAANSQRIRMSADGAEAIVRQTALPFLPPPPIVQAPPPPTEYYEEEPVYGQPQTIIIERESPRFIEIIRDPVYLAPGIGRRHHGHGRLDRGFDNRGGFDSHKSFDNHNNFDRRGGFAQPHRRRHHNASPPAFSTPAPTHMPFGASHMPFGTSSTPPGIGQRTR